MTNQTNNPNSFLEPFHNETYLVAGTAVFGVTLNGETKIVGLHAWHDTEFVTHTPLILPINTKKASVRVMVKEGQIAPKHPAFVSLDDGVTFDYDDDVPYVLNHSANPKAMPLLDGSEVEVFGFENIKKLMFFNNRVYTSGGGAQTKYNETPINYLLNIALFK